VYKELRLKSNWLPRLLFFGMIFLYAYSISSFYGILYSWPHSIHSGLNIFHVVAILILLYSFLYWYCITLQSSRERGASLSTDEYSCIAYFVPTIVVGVLTVLWTSLHDELTWESRSEPTLVFLMILHFFYTVSVSSTCL